MVNLLTPARSFGIQDSDLKRLNQENFSKVNMFLNKYSHWHNRHPPISFINDYTKAKQKMIYCRFNKTAITPINNSSSGLKSFSSNKIFWAHSIFGVTGNTDEIYSFGGNSWSRCWMVQSVFCLNIGIGSARPSGWVEISKNKWAWFLYDDILYRGFI